MWSLLLFSAVQASQVDLSNCLNNCSKDGECHEVFLTESSLNLTTSAEYICICYEGYTGVDCGQCVFGNFGSSCTKCPMKNSLLCSGNGVCDMGKEGSGQCKCFPGFNPSSDCSEETNVLKEWHIQSQVLSFFLISLILCILMMHGIHKMPRQFLPSSCGAILLGIIIGLTLKLKFPDSAIYGSLSFNPQVFFLIIIPPIILEAGLSLQKARFFSNLGTILMFGVPGTIISALIFAQGLYLLSEALGLFEFTMVECLLFGSLVSALDPVATLTIFRAMGLDKDLQAIVLGESVVCDAVAITMFKILSSYNTDDEWKWVAVQFTYVILGSSLFGIAFGMVSALIYKYVTSLKNEAAIEMAMFVLLSYFPFLLCEAINLSGILCLLFVGMTMALYTKSWLSNDVSIAVNEGFGVFSFICESFCFLYLGISIAGYKLEGVVSLIVCSVILMLASRGIVVFTFSLISNRYRKTQISFAHQCLLWLSGLRGAVAFSLALSFPSNNPDLIISTTQYLILFTIFSLSVGIYPILKGLKVIDELSPIERTSGFILPDNPDDSRTWIEDLDSKYLQKWFKKPSIIEK